MKHSKFFLLLWLAAAVLPAVDVLAAAKEPQGAKPFYVKVRETKLRQTPSYFAGIAASVRYGEQLTPLAVNSEQWIQVKTAKGAKGFIHTSSLSDKKIVLASSSKTFFDSGFDSSEVVLAGKGFSADIEKAYAASNSGLRFDAVDRAEKLKVSQAELVSFLREGGLSKPRG